MCMSLLIPKPNRSDSANLEARGNKLGKEVAKNLTPKPSSQMDKDTQEKMKDQLLNPRKVSIGQVTAAMKAYANMKAIQEGKPKPYPGVSLKKVLYSHLY